MPWGRQRGCILSDSLIESAGEGKGSRPGVGNRLLRRTLPLVILGSAIALAVATFTSAVTYQTDLVLAIGAGHRDGLTFVEMLTLDAEDPDQVLSTVVFRFDREHRPEGDLQHTLRLTAGDYNLVFRLRKANGRTREIRKNLHVSSDASVHLVIP